MGLFSTIVEATATVGYVFVSHSDLRHRVWGGNNGGKKSVILIFITVQKWKSKTCEEILRIQKQILRSGSLVACASKICLTSYHSSVWRHNNHTYYIIPLVCLTSCHSSLWRHVPRSRMVVIVWWFKAENKNRRRNYNNKRLGLWLTDAIKHRYLSTRSHSSSADPRLGQTGAT